MTGDDEALRRAVGWAGSWLASLPDRPVARPVDPDVLRAGFVTELPDEGVDPATVIDELATAWEPGLVATGGPRFFGFVTGGTLPAAMAADWLVSAFDQNAAVQVMSPSTAVLEAITAAWVLDLLGLPAGSAVGFVTGGQMANLTCLAAARHALLAGEGWDVEADGLAGAPVPTVVLGARAHSTVLQALRLLGFGSARARRVPTDDQGRMLPTALRTRARRERGARPGLRPGRRGQHRRGRPARRRRRRWSARGPGRGCTSTAPSACGARRAPSTDRSCAASSAPTRGRSTPTSG